MLGSGPGKLGLIARDRFGDSRQQYMEIRSQAAACPAAGGSRGGRRRHFLPLLDSM